MNFKGAIFIKTAIDCLKVGNLFCTPKCTLELNIWIYSTFSEFDSLNLLHLYTI